ncbi:helix-turn-helix domain-containing protein [Tenacibaculum sp. M341]|uniref:helix-turn-helix domain-containing protein n=1 Tax=Tenacibaculum sp. M341 TaxID=2530339 RepID=UPI00104AA7F8|nr:AraC family transcriptional regulator [Tenacibaculum sp. M341]
MLSIQINTNFCLTTTFRNDPLLLNPNFSISETAYKLGFEYPQYFTRLFKKKVGVSPKAYIKTQLN